MVSFSGETGYLILCHFHDSSLCSFPTLCSRSRSISGGFCLASVLAQQGVELLAVNHGYIPGRVGQCDPGSSWVTSVDISHRQVGTVDSNQSHPERERARAWVTATVLVCFLLPWQTPWPKATSKGSIYLLLSFQVAVYHPQKPEEKLTKIEVIEFTGVLQAKLSYRSHTSQDHLLKSGLAHSELDPPTSSQQSKKAP